MRMRAANTTTFYAATFEVYPDDPKNEIWPTIVKVFQDWILQKEDKLYNRINRPREDKQKVQDFDIGSAALWRPGLRISAYSALSIRKELIKRAEEKMNSSRRYSKKTKRNEISSIAEAINEQMIPWEPELNDGSVYLEKVLLSKSFASGDFSVGNNRSILHAKAIKDSAPIPAHWAMDYVEKDRDYWWRSWRTSAGITRSDIGTYFVTVNVCYEVDSAYMRDDISSPLRNIPICVRNLLKVKGITCISGEDPLSDKAACVGESRYSFSQFCEDLTKPIRKMPLVTITSNEEGKLPVNAKVLAEKTMSVAQIVVLDLSKSGVAEQLESTFSNYRKYKPTLFSVKVYLPLVNLGDDLDARRHYQFPDSWMRNRSDNLEDQIASDIVASAVRAFSYSENIVGSCQDINKLIDDKHRAELAQRFRENSENSEKRERQYKELKTKYKRLLGNINGLEKKNVATESEVSQMREMIAATMSDLNQANITVKEQNEYVDLLEEDNRELSSRVAKGEERVNDLNQALNEARWQISSLADQLSKKICNDESSGIEKIDSFPSNVEESLIFSEKAFPKNLVILPEAFVSAKNLEQEILMKFGR